MSASCLLASRRLPQVRFTLTYKGNAFSRQIDFFSNIFCFFSWGIIGVRVLVWRLGQGTAVCYQV